MDDSRPSTNTNANTNANANTNTNSNSNSNSNNSLNAAIRRRPPLRLRNTDRGDKRRYVYSTDDDEQEWEADLEREYNEGYSDGLKNRRRRNDDVQRSSSVGVYHVPSNSNKATPDGGRPGQTEAVTSRFASPELTRVSSGGNEAGQKSSLGVLRNAGGAGGSTRSTSVLSSEAAGPSRGGASKDSTVDVGVSTARASNSVPMLSVDDAMASIRHQPSVSNDNLITSDLDQSGRGGESEISAYTSERDNAPGSAVGGSEEEEDDGDEDDGQASIASNETFTLRERQEAINTSHPFGIRIWKPAIYKKSRSVQKIAEGDIHSTPGKQVAWYVWLGNLLWTVMFGTLLLAVCTFASATCFLAFWSPSARQYGRILFLLGKYLWFPFGHYVELSQDKKYLHEDEGEGRSISEYERWQAGDVEYGRLFFGPAHRRDSSATRGSMSAGGDLSGSSTLTGGRTGREEMALDHDSEDEDHDDNAFEASTQEEEDEDDMGNEDSPLISRKRRFFGRGNWNFGRVLFYLWFWIVLWPLLYGISLICWLGVFSIPMARVTSTLTRHLRKHPLALNFRPASSYSRSSKPSSIILCTYRALGWNYYKYTIDGTNIIIINLLVPTIFVVLDYYILDQWLELNTKLSSPEVLFIMSLVSVIPLAYFIGQAVASISAQSSMGMGAAINAFFSTVVEVFLYSVALAQGKGHLVEGSIVGSILAGVLLMPGLSMCAGAIRRKTQRYNPRSAGVSSTMLVFAVIGAFAPTVFYQIYGPYELKCGQQQQVIYSMQTYDNADTVTKKCQVDQVPLEDGAFYRQIIRPLSITCALYLFVSYVIGLWFTLRTHAAMIWAIPTASETEGLLLAHSAATTTQAVPIVDHETGGSRGVAGLAISSPAQGSRPKYTLTVQHPSSSPHMGHTVGDSTSPNATPALTSAVPCNPRPRKVMVDLAPSQKQQLQHRQQQQLQLQNQHESAAGHDAPNWSRTKSTIILLGATLLYAIIAEILVDTVDVVLKNFAISPKLLGITVFALVPNTTEFLNAISFAINGNIALSMEIGSAYALQVCLLQIPALVLYTCWKDTSIVGPINQFIFSLVFPRWDLYVVIFCVFLFSYIYAEGKSNYFKGSILILAYLVSITGFVLADSMADLD